jgi:hypothetical protein
VGIDAEDGFEDKEAKKQRDEYVVTSRARKILKEMGARPKEVAKEVEMEEAPEEEAPMPSKGLMSRGDM